MPVDFVFPVRSTPGNVVTSKTVLPSQQAGAACWGVSTNRKSFSRELMPTSRLIGAGTSKVQVLPLLLVRMAWSFGRTSQVVTGSLAVTTTVVGARAANRA